jgi:hypothetical protein
VASEEDRIASETSAVDEGAKKEKGVDWKEVRGED